MNACDIVIIGGGPAGLAAAESAFKAGVTDIMILERDSRLGGILNQCIHNGFGLHTFREELTGPEYASRYERKIRELGIPYSTETMVTDLGTDESGDKLITCMNRQRGMYRIKARALILAMGCRERPRGAVNTPGYRGAGVFSAGTAQLYVNIHGYMPGKTVVIVGSGDIGLIMARRMTLEGAKVRMVVEIMDHSGGLKRNIIQCLNDFGIPLKLSHTVTEIRGKDRVEGVVVASVDERRRPIPGTEEYVECDTVLYSVGLIPENELTRKLGAGIDDKTGGPVVKADLELSIPGVFACGNVLHVHDIVDHVSEESAHAGENAAAYIRDGRVPEGAGGYVDSEEKNVYRPGENEDRLTCIMCPNGCELTAVKDDDGKVKVSGNRCPKGVRYATEELTAPRRIVTTTVKLEGGGIEALPVKTDRTIPKDKISDVIKELTGVSVTVPVSTGDVIIHDIAGTGADIIAGTDITADTDID
ncbi:MAG: FAD-dependent oxidoreductase [Lachnospiraceae bacterium]|nr:FAD-dependent oxidoreductase [Lachnospiraceae bacterium]